jgi:ubiquinone/menaquinone biosynthesis C-methylase UbiE
MSDDEYVLRDRDEDEISRLELQHNVWKQETDCVVRKAGFKPGDRLLDMGSGPGFLTFDLADLVGPSGSVLALDNSEFFIEHLRREARAQNLDWVRGEVADIREYAFEESSLDGAISRWVLMFLSDPEAVLARIARALRPGGTLAVMEYVQFKSMSLWPDGRNFRRLYDAVFDLIAQFGGDADVGGRIPGLLQHTGFEVVELYPMMRVGRSGSPLWIWLDAATRNHPNLVEAGLLSAPELEAFEKEWDERSKDPTAFFTAPPVLATIAQRR